MAKSNIASIGRFSSQMLTYLGTQRTVKSVTGTALNTFKYSTGSPVFPNPGNIAQADLGGGVVGSYSPTVYNTTRCFFLSRGATLVYADTMTGLVIDTAAMLGVSVQYLLERTSAGNKLRFSDEAYRAMNQLRDPGNQIGSVTPVKNKNSLQASQIRS